MYSSEVEVLNINKDVVWVQDCSSKEVFMTTDRELAISTTIGKEPMLNDVLEWYSRRDSKSHFEISEGIGFFYCYAKCRTEGTKVVEVDLSKPYLKDWSEEVINFLYELL